MKKYDFDKEEGQYIMDSYMAFTKDFNEPFRTLDDIIEDLL